ncbi:hypothetical protein ACRRTK_020042 [Alexandromys fortis]
MNEYLRLSLKICLQYFLHNLGNLCNAFSFSVLLSYSTEELFPAKLFSCP